MPLSPALCIAALCSAALCSNRQCRVALLDQSRMLVATEVFTAILSDHDAQLPLPGDPKLWAITVAYAGTYLLCFLLGLALPPEVIHSPNCSRMANSVVGGVSFCKYGAGYGIVTFALVSALPYKWQWFGKRRLSEQRENPRKPAREPITLTMEYLQHAATAAAKHHREQLTEGNSHYFFGALQCECRP